MVLKIYGIYRSPATCLVVLVAREKGVPFEFIDVDMANWEHKSAAFLEKQPFGQFPYIVRISLLPAVCLSSTGC